MSDRAAERRLCRPPFVNMNELVVVGSIGKQVDPFLCDLEPFGRLELGADQRGQVAGSGT